MKWIELFFSILFITSFGKILSQNSEPKPLPYKSTDLDLLYKDCKKIRPDSILRLCTSFMNDYNLRKNKEAAEIFCAKMIKKAEHDKDNNILNRLTILQIIGKLRFKKIPTKDVVNTYETKFNKFLENEDFSAALEIMTELAKHHHSHNEVIEILKVLFYAEKFVEKYNLNNDVNYQTVLHLLGYTFWKMENTKTSNDYFHKSLNFEFSPDFENLLSYNAMGINYQKMDSLEKSLFYFNKGVELAKNTNNKIFLKIIQGNAAYTLYKLGKHKEALAYAEIDKELSLNERIYDNAVGAMNLIMKIELEQKNWVKAKSILEEFPLVMSCIKNTDYYSLKRFKEAEYLYYEKTKNYSKALNCYKEYNQYEDAFVSGLDKNKIPQMKIDAAVKIYADIMDQKAKTINFRNNLKTGLMVIFVIALIFVIYFLINKSRAIEKDKIEIENISKNQAEEIMHLKSELNVLIAKIIYENEKYQKSINLIENQQQVNSIQNIENETDIILSETISDSSEKIEHLKNYNLSRNEQWHEFKNLFLKLYPAFDIKLNEKLGKVSNAELRLMMLHKLGLSSKEIAHILFISMEGVKKSKYRLYKKMGISSNTELDLFLQKL